MFGNSISDVCKEFGTRVGALGWRAAAPVCALGPLRSRCEHPLAEFLNTRSLFLTDEVCILRTACFPRFRYGLIARCYALFLILDHLLQLVTACDRCHFRVTVHLLSDAGYQMTESRRTCGQPLLGQNRGIYPPSRSFDHPW